MAQGSGGLNCAEKARELGNSICGRDKSHSGGGLKCTVRARQVGSLKREEGRRSSPTEGDIILINPPGGDRSGGGARRRMWAAGWGG